MLNNIKIEEKDLLDYSYMSNEDLQKNFELLRIKSEDICQNVSKILREYAFMRKQLLSYLKEFEKRSMDIKI